MDNIMSTTTNVECVRWLVTVKGSLRWWFATSTGHGFFVKGAISFEALDGPTLTYRIRYNGIRVFDDAPHRNYNTADTIFLPDSEWKLEHTKVQSKNAKGRVIVLLLMPRGYASLQRLQLSVPISDDDDGKLFVKAVERAQTERKQQQDHEERKQQQDQR